MSLRFRQRHIHKTVSAYVQSGLTTLGWVNAPVNFGTTAFTFMESQPEEEGIAVTQNTVAISVGNEDTDTLEELGGGLYSTIIPMFFDVYSNKASLSISVASDIKDLLGRGKVIYAKDWTDPSVPVQVNELIYFEDVAGPEKPESAAVATDFRRHWRVIKALAHVYYGPTTDVIPITDGLIFVGDGPPNIVPGSYPGAEYLDDTTGDLYRLS